jgi:membrane protein YdbS with pleckstrin-like domain
VGSTRRCSPSAVSGRPSRRSLTALRCPWISAVATAAATFVAGYAHGFVGVAAVAALVAVVTIVATPSPRRGAEAQAEAHG